jgi:hypothetical protein
MVNNTDPLNEDIEFFFDTAYALLRTGTPQQIFDILGNVIGTLSVGGDGTHSLLFHGDSCSCKYKSSTRGTGALGFGAVVALVNIPNQLIKKGTNPLIKGGTNQLEIGGVDARKVTAAISSSSLGVTPTGYAYNQLILQSSLVDNISHGIISTCASVKQNV